MILPFARLPRISRGPWRQELQAVAIALLISIAIGSALMLIAGRSPGTVWWAMITRTAIGAPGFGETPRRRPRRDGPAKVTVVSPTHRS